jgi:hypothetical protein
VEKDKIIEDISRFEQKRILKMGIQFLLGILAASLLFFPVMGLLEYFFYLSPAFKISFLGLYLVSVFSLLFVKIIKPWWDLHQTKSLEGFEKLSSQVSSRVSGLDDKLINYLQLLSISLKDNRNSLVSYSLGQKRDLLSGLNIPEKINLNIPVGLLKRIIPVALAGLLLVLFFFDFVKEGSNRFVHINQQYTPPAPFEIKTSEIPGRILATQSLEIRSLAEGTALPENLFVKIGSRTIKMNREKPGFFSQTIQNLEVGNHLVSVFSGNISSQTQNLEVLAPGHITGMSIQIIPPAYTLKSKEILENEGNLQIPKGSKVVWNLSSENLNSLSLVFGKQAPILFSEVEKGKFSQSQQVLQSVDYQIDSRNILNQPDQKLNYSIEVVEDEFPRIQVSSMQDSVNMSQQYFVGRVADDYGFSQLKAVALDPATRKVLAEASVPISRSEKNQPFAYVPQGKIATLMGQNPILLSFKVWDNDGVSGPKLAESQIFNLKDASKEFVSESVDRLDKKNEENLEELVKKTETLEKNSKKMLESLRGKKELNWQDKKELQNFVDKQKDLFKQIEELKKEAEKSLQNKEDNKLMSQELLEKQEQINKMLDEILDEKTKEMLKELEKLLENQQMQNKDQLQEAFEKMQDKNEFIQNELDRAMEMLKQLKVEEKLEKATKDLEKLAEEQNKAGEENEKNGDNQSQEQKQQAKEKQEKLNDMFKQVQEDVKELQKLNQELEDKNQIDSGQEEQKEIEKEQQESGEKMQQGKMQKAGNQQKNAAKKMKKMAQKMEKSLMEMQGGGDQDEDIGDLRYIIENLLTLSFDQEEVYKEISKINQLDPKYLALTQKQVKIKEDAEIIKDSLKVLAKRVPQIQSFVMKELYAMDAAIDDAVKYVKARRPDISSGKGQQAMTNINNLTVMLKDALQQMQQQQQQQSKGGKACKKPGKGKPKPGGMSQMQKQLNEQISQLKNGKKPGQQMSKELAQIAQKQAALRRALGELEKSMQKGKDKSGGLGDVKQMMEKTERELLNKKFTPETVMRQQQILTRLLESEKALMERELDQRREAEKPNSKERTTLPAEIRDLLKKGQSQKEQLQQGTPKLTDMYQEVFDKYFESIQNNGR